MSESPIPILLVDDDPVFSSFVEALLDETGEGRRFAVTHATSAEQALAKLQGGGYRLVLLDHRLPGADGFSVLSRIGALPPALRPPVIMLSGNDSPEFAIEASRLGAQGLLLKHTLDLPSLSRAVDGALASGHQC